MNGLKPLLEEYKLLSSQAHIHSGLFVVDPEPWQQLSPEFQVLGVHVPEGSEQVFWNLQIFPSRIALQKHNHS